VRDGYSTLATSFSKLGRSTTIDGYWTVASTFVRRLVFDVERGIPDFIGEGEFCAMLTCLLRVSGVKLTCFVAFGVPVTLAVVGTEGSALFRFGLLGLLDNVGIEVGTTFGFFALELGYRRMDLTRSNLLGLCKKLFGSVL
jgi:hypothetical protein